MGELKSAWEIAQEKADRLGRLSAEEQEQQKKERCRQAGQVLAQKWLDTSEELDIAAELNRYGEEEKGMIRQAIIDRLVEAINFESPGGLVKAIQGIANLEPESQPTIEGITGLVQEYEQAERKRRRELQGPYREILHELRISGTAVGDINVEATSQWQQSQRRLIEALAPRLNELKQELLRLS
jgi:hypothetical protein